MVRVHNKRRIYLPLEADLFSLDLHLSSCSNPEQNSSGLYEDWTSAMYHMGGRLGFVLPFKHLSCCATSSKVCCWKQFAKLKNRKHDSRYKQTPCVLRDSSENEYEMLAIMIVTVLVTSFLI
jgi:hypothetical protein